MLRKSRKERQPSTSSPFAGTLVGPAICSRQEVANLQVLLTPAALLSTRHRPRYGNSPSTIGVVRVLPAATGTETVAGFRTMIHTRGSGPGWRGGRTREGPVSRVARVRLLRSRNRRRVRRRAPTVCRRLWRETVAGGLFCQVPAAMAAVTPGACMPGKELGSESGQTFLVRPRLSFVPVFPFSSFSRSDHSGWDLHETTFRGVHP